MSKPDKRTKVMSIEFIDMESQLLSEGNKVVCGIDEAGRGPLAGPVVAAAVVLGPNCSPEGLADSKLLSPAQREKLYDIIMANAIAVGIGASSVEVIDRDNILQATFSAMREAVTRLSVQPDYAMVDGKFIPTFDCPSRAVIGGDRIVRSIAAASIIAKVTRDRQMVELDALYPGYGFAQHKGYCTRSHVAAIERLGRCPIHRLSFHVPGIAAADQEVV